MGSRVWNIKTVEERDFMVQSVPIIYRYKDYIMPHQPYWGNRYYESLFGKECGYKDIKDICELSGRIRMGIQILYTKLS